MYLSFLDDAVRSLEAGVRAYELLLAQEESKRDAPSLSAAIVDIHTAIDKGLKHALCAVSPTLLFKTIDQAVVLEMFKEQRAASAPTVFALLKRWDTHNIAGLLNRVRSVISPSINPDLWTQFESACDVLRSRRDQVVHGELFGESADLLENLTRVLSRLRPVLGVICPDLLSRAYVVNDQLESRLTGIENEVDSGWQVLYDYLKPPRVIALQTSLYVELLPDSQEVSILIGGGGPSLSNPALLAMGVMPASAATGDFLRASPAGQGRFWSEAPAVGGIEPHKENLGLGPLSIQSAFERARLNSMRVGEKGLLAADDGEITIASVSGWGSLRLEGRKQSFLSLAVLLKDWRIALQKDSEEVALVGGLLPGRTIAGKGTGSQLSISGELHMQAEWVRAEAVGESPAGTTVRSFKGRVQISR